MKTNRIISMFYSFHCCHTVDNDDDDDDDDPISINTSQCTSLLG